ncbi:unnamed protein product [Rotaria sp. Silwood2]|nr:unnamed protein product [Rotaria sp. Silwood2]CAF3183379.1 unnamed protein product [Rotaria sp. Silwood2]CAF4465479.1 unnamed protein product [Rotaria sp. Silwood2]CAF4571291.1 unnamed protein product [Rotaria sp. Silwood2]
MNNLNLNTFYEFYDHESDKNNDLFTTKILEYFDVRYTHSNKSIIEEKINHYILRNRTKFYDVWRKCNKKQKEQQFADIVVLTQEDFHSSPFSDTPISIKRRSPSSTAITICTSSTTTFSYLSSQISTVDLSTTTKRQRDFSEVSSCQKRRRLSD